ncbi:kinetochore Sim4 complex subunit FTA2-domain-containing protein [Xylaria sp. FL0064]|nr:kinetochore Sim4 complex subunit FTA2-domain-containing protein [Xylaria sp. FL0064]
MKDVVRKNRRLLLSPELPPYDGPKLRAFQYRNDPIEWLGSLEDRPIPPGSTRQGYVFKVKIRSKIYALKVFKFFDPSTYRWFLGSSRGEHVSDDVLAFHSDPFYVECRAYGRLQHAREKQGLKRCDFAESYGFLALNEEDAAYLETDLGIDLWDIPSTDEYRRAAEGSPVRAIVKELIASDPVVNENLLRKILKGIRWINKHNVLVANIRLENYKGGVLVDFGMAWTIPHCGWVALPDWQKKGVHAMDEVHFQEMVDDMGLENNIRSTPNYDYKKKLREGKRKLYQQ